MLLNKINKQAGAVSLFVVVFSALLITIITVGFIGLMVRNQRQASDNDLSQSAYDSALAGVEDGKRVTLRYMECLNDSTVTGCSDIMSWIENPDIQTCTNLVRDLYGVTLEDEEIKVKSANNDDLNQAYTCLKININTPDYLGFLEKDGSKLIPLIGTGSYDNVKLDWFMPKDLETGSVATIPPFGTSNEKLMLDNNDWVNIPSVMRAQLIQYSNTGSFSLDQLDNNVGATNSNTNTLFLYPSDSVTNSVDLMDDKRRDTSSNILKQVSCEENFEVDGASGYACTATLLLPDPINGDKANRVAYLNLTAFYSQANFKVSLFDGSNLVNFKAVQPEIDSNGRANDLFRRVKVRTEMFSANNLIPTAAVDLEGKFCKDYTIYTSKEPANNC